VLRISRAQLNENKVTKAKKIHLKRAEGGVSQVRKEKNTWLSKRKMYKLHEVAKVETWRYERKRGRRNRGEP